MDPNHKVKINISGRDGNRKRVLTARSSRIPSRIAKLIFGDFSEVLILKPGKSVRRIEIHEIKDGGDESER